MHLQKQRRTGGDISSRFKSRFKTLLEIPVDQLITRYLQLKSPEKLTFKRNAMAESTKDERHAAIIY